MVWYSHLSKDFPQFVVIYTVVLKGEPCTNITIDRVSFSVLEEILNTVVLQDYPMFPRLFEINIYPIKASAKVTDYQEEI